LPKIASANRRKKNTYTVHINKLFVLGWKGAFETKKKCTMRSEIRKFESEERLVCVEHEFGLCVES